MCLRSHPAAHAGGLGNLPLYFEANHGQADPPAQFIARGRDYQFLISPAEAQIVLRKTGAETGGRCGCNLSARIRGRKCPATTELPGKINYLIGNDPAHWHTGVATFAQVRVGQLYPGINLVYYGNQQQLEYDFAIAPGANPDAITIHFDGVDKISHSRRANWFWRWAEAKSASPSR